tara:strand:- start:39 stop:719 length:681 start_codon:yes stop_codon:yes gene_type:complete
MTEENKKPAKEAGSSTIKLAKALVNSLKDIKNPELDGRNPHYKSRYATLASCLKVVKEPLAKNDLCITQEIHGDRVYTILIHSSGETRKDGGVDIRVKDPDNPQAMGGAITYARRYGLCTMLGIVGEDDDDGNSAVKPAIKPLTSIPKPPSNVTPMVKTETDQHIWDTLIDEIREQMALSKTVGAVEETASDYREKVNQMSTTYQSKVIAIKQSRLGELIPLPSKP